MWRFIFYGSVQSSDTQCAVNTICAVPRLSSVLVKRYIKMHVYTDRLSQGRNVSGYENDGLGLPKKPDKPPRRHQHLSKASTRKTCKTLLIQNRRHFQQHTHASHYGGQYFVKRYYVLAQKCPTTMFHVSWKGLYQGGLMGKANFSNTVFPALTMLTL